MKASLPAPPGFSFRRTVLSHGWCTLAPFRLGRGVATLGITARLPSGGTASIRIAPEAGGVLVESPGRRRREIEAVVRRVLAFDVDLGPFHRAVRASPALSWIAETGTGRLLRAPTVFEDLVKLVLTTNCSWSLTVRTVEALVRLWGEPAADGTRAFPTAAALARASEASLRNEARVGYRAPYVLALAKRVAGGEIDPESWSAADRDANELRGEMLELPGVGPYVAENLLKLLGRPRGLALDSWMRGKYARIHHGGRTVTDRTIARRYAKLGDWAGHALWFELTQDWFEGDEPSEAWARLG